MLAATNLQVQLEQVDRKNQDLLRVKKKLSADLDHVSREKLFYEKQCNEQTKEIKLLKDQIQSVVNISVLSNKNSSNSKRIVSGVVRKVGENKKNSAILEELEHYKQQSGQLSKQLTDKEKDYEDMKLKVKVLEDALAFRSEEIGLAGHADLLAKLAQLKAEVSAMKMELQQKSQKLTVVEQDKTSLSTQRETLEQQITDIQRRLAHSQEETFKYKHSDIGLLLKAAEQERDLLLDYIQQDMNKNTTLSAHVENLEQELRSARAKEETLSYLEAEHAVLLSQISEAQSSSETVTKENAELLSQLNKLRSEHEALQRMTERKAQENEEVLKSQVTLYAQVGSHRHLNAVLHTVVLIP